MNNQEPEVITNEEYQYGRLWADGTFNKLGWSNERHARREFEEKAYEIKEVPASMRPVFARQRVIKTTAIYPAEALPDATA